MQSPLTLQATGKFPVKRLLVITSTFPRWCDDKEPPFVYELCRRLTENFSVCVLAPHFPGSKRKEIMENVRVQRFRYFFPQFERLAYNGGMLNNVRKRPYLALLIPLFLVSQTIHIFRLLKKHSFSAIHVHWLFPQGLTALIAKTLTKSTTPIICTSHGGDLYGLKGSLFQWIKHLVFSKASKVTVVSTAMKKDVVRLGIRNANIHVIPMGVDLKNRFVPLPGSSNTGSLLFVGRLVDKKGLQYLIDALPQVQAAHPYVQLRVAGNGPEKKHLLEKVRKMRLERSVVFLGAIENKNLPRLYQQADIVVFPSVIADGGDREGFGLVLVEALGCECAVISTDLPAMRDIIIDGETGIIVPQKNSSRLVNEIINLLDNPVKKRKLSKNGRNFVIDRFDWRHIVESYTTLIYSVINHNDLI